MPDFLPSVRSALKEADAPLRTLDALAADLPPFFIIDMIYDRV
jgi:hypothetical protein